MATRKIVVTGSDLVFAVKHFLESKGYTVDSNKPIVFDYRPPADYGDTASYNASVTLTDQSEITLDREEVMRAAEWQVVNQRNMKLRPGSISLIEGVQTDANEDKLKVTVEVEVKL